MARLSGFADRRDRAGILDLAIVNEHASVVCACRFEELVAIREQTGRKTVYAPGKTFFLDEWCVTNGGKLCIAMVIWNMTSLDVNRDQSNPPTYT